MIKFDIITVFPGAFDSYLNTSMLKRAQAKKLVDISIHDLRKFASDKHKKVDDRPYGGGPGMVLKIEPLIRAVGSVLRTNPKSQILNPKQIPNSKFSKLKTKIILFSAAGKQFDSKMASDFAKKYDRIIMIAGHYEGVDERVKRVFHDSGFMIQELSVGPYVLTGGELPAMVVIDAVSRHLPGFLGKAESLEEKRYGVGVPVYTRPETFFVRGGLARAGMAKGSAFGGKHKGKNYRVPEVLLSGAHKKIAAWREIRARRASL